MNSTSKLLAFALIAIASTSAHAEVEVIALYAASPTWEFTEIEEGGRFKHEDGNSFIQVFERQFGHRVQFSLAAEDATTPQFQAAIFVKGDKWLDLNFGQNGGEGGFFNPYGLPFNDDWTSSRHILPPSESPYVMAKSLLDVECNFNAQPCSESKRDFLDYRYKEIEPPILGDVNLDGVVGFDDFLRLSSYFGKDIWVEPAPGWFTGDFDLDGVPDMDDFLALSANFGRSKDASALSTVPEPTGPSVWLMCIPLLLLQNRIRRHTVR